MRYISIAIFTFLQGFLGAQIPNAKIVTEQIDSLIRLSRAACSQGDFSDALRLNDLGENLLTPEQKAQSAESGSLCFNRGRIFHIKGDFQEAEKWYQKGLKIRASVLDAQHPDLAKSLNNLSVLYYNLGEFAKAEPLYRKSLEIRAAAYGKAHPEYLKVLGNLGNLMAELGRFEEAEEIFREEKDARLALIKTDTAAYALSLSHLGDIQRELGKFELAEARFLEALDLQKKIRDGKGIEFAVSKINLANLYFKISNFDKAEKLYTEAAQVLENEKNAKTFYRLCVENLAALYLETGQFEKSENLFQRVLRESEKETGKSTAGYAKILSNLGVLYRRKGDFSKAEQCYHQAKNTYLKVFGKDNSDYARTINNLGDLYFLKGDLQKAEPLFLEALQTRRQIFGTDNQEYLSGLQSLSDYYAEISDNELASKYFTEASEMQQKLLTKGGYHLSEHELNHYRQKFKETSAKMLSFLFKTEKPEHPIAETAYNEILFYKGFLLNTLSQVKNAALSTTGSARKYNLLKSYRRRLAKEYAKPAAERKEVEALEAKANDAEKAIARSVAGFSEVFSRVKTEEVRKHLLSGEAAIEFIRFPFYKKNVTDSVLYAALVLQPDRSPRFIPLFEEKQLNAFLQSKQKSPADFVNDLYRSADKGLPAFIKPKPMLYDLIWKPLEKELEEVHTIYFSPDGKLHRINLSAVPTPSASEVLGETYRLIQLIGTRRLAAPFGKKTASGNPSLFGGIRYEPDSTATFDPGYTFAAQSFRTRGNSFFKKTDLTLRGGTWNYLPQTKEEVAVIAELLKSSDLEPKIYTAHQASEETFKSIDFTEASPHILHLATHGYFFPDPSDVSKNLRQESAPVFQISDHPMIRSGLILAGGNHAWETGKPFKNGPEDGILTAYEISQMDLSNTELAVLSACETGLGDIEGNEGVYGLQRAFKIAGVNYLIMSLWQVPDKDTKEFMTSFYRYWLTEQLPIQDAFRKTQQAMKSRYFHPYRWAGFVLVE